MKTKLIWFLALSLSAAALIFFFFHPKVNESTKRSTSNVQAVILGNDRFDNMEGVTYLNKKWGDAIPKDAMYVLISHKETLTKQKRASIQAMLDERHVVLFYGQDVQPESVMTKLGFKTDPIAVQANATFSYLLYGYGYSPLYQKEIFVFLGGSASDDHVKDKINKFLQEKAAEFSGQ